MMPFPIDKTWTLFLDRDGVLNQRIVGGYVLEPSQFVWLPHALTALSLLTPLFARTVVVTNQQGVGKGLMTQAQLDVIHSKMKQQVAYVAGHLDAVYACTALALDNDVCRKPQPGMAYEAQSQFPEIDFAKSVVVGDSDSDMAFGRAVGMRTVFVGESPAGSVDLVVSSLWEFATKLVSTTASTDRPELPIGLAR